MLETWKKPQKTVFLVQLTFLDMEKDQMFSVKDVCSEYGVSEATVRKLVKTGYLEAVDDVKPLKITKDSCNSYFKTEPDSVKILKLQTEMNSVIHVLNTHIKPLVARVHELEEKLKLFEDAETILQKLQDGWK